MEESSIDDQVNPPNSPPVSTDVPPLDTSYKTPTEIVAALGTGINMGNTLDAPSEGEWALVAQEYYYDAYKDAGFGHVRIPITWDTRVANQAPYDIDNGFLNRVEEIVDWAIERDFYVMLNAHHESWLKNDINASKRARFVAVWTQVAERFKNKSSKLLFEILNEPNGMTLAEIDSLNSSILEVIRQTNPTRAVIYSGNGYTPAEAMKQADIPNDPNIIANFHSYDPWPFAGQCTRSWGSEADRLALRGIYQDVSNWSENFGIPVIVNEFGAAMYDFTQPQNICNENDRLEYLKAHVTLQKEFGIPGTVWCDGGSFQIYDRSSNTFSNALSSLIF